MTGYERFGIAVVDHAEPLLRATALVGIPLYEQAAGMFAVEQMYAPAESRDTRWLRELDLQSMSTVRRSGTHP